MPLEVYFLYLLLKQLPLVIYSLKSNGRYLTLGESKPLYLVMQ